jgi:AcrR family transcriptional regulator
MGAPPVGDPRIARTRANVLRCATDLLVEGGPSAVTIEAIVARSGVARSTIYRHWDTRDDVLLEVIEGCAPHIDAPDPSLGFEDALRALVAELCEVLSDPDWSRVLPALLALRNQEHGIAALEQRLEARQDHALESVLQRGIDEGRLPPDLDHEQAIALLVGPLLFANLTGKLPVGAGFGTTVVDSFLHTFSSTPVPG